MTMRELYKNLPSLDATVRMRRDTDSKALGMYCKLCHMQPLFNCRKDSKRLEETFEIGIPVWSTDKYRH